jgi:hypothetical protein
MTAFKAWASQAGQIGNDAAFPPNRADADGYCEWQKWGNSGPNRDQNLSAEVRRVEM